MKNYFERFQALLNDEDSKQRTSKDLLLLIEILDKELDCSRKNANYWQKQYETILNSESFNLTSKCSQLQGINKELEAGNLKLHDELDELKVKSFADIDQLKKDFSVEKDEIERKFRGEIGALTAKLDSNKLKEQELYDELRVLQTINTIESMEIESRLKQQLDESCMKQRELNKSNNNLRTELVNLKQNYSHNITLSNRKIDELQKQLRHKNELIKECIGSGGGSDTKCHANDEPMNFYPDDSIVNCSTVTVTEPTTRYHPLNINQEHQMRPQTSSSSSVSLSLNRNHAPPLMACSNAKKDKTDKSSAVDNQQAVIKRRKLFDPNSCEYYDI